MKVVVRDEHTGKYLANEGSWVQEVAAAKDFNTLQNAGREAKSLDESSVVLSYEDPPCQLAINPAFCE